MKTALIITSLIALAVIGLVGLGDALGPLFMAFGLAYLLFPLVKKLETKGIKRDWAIAGVFTLLFLILVGSGILFIPELVKDTKNFVSQLPKTSGKAIDSIVDIAAILDIELDLSTSNIKEYVTEHMTSVSSSFLKSLSKLVTGAFSNAMGWLLGILNLFLIPLFFFYVMSDYEKISSELTSFLPNQMQKKANKYSELCNTVLSGYIRGQLLVAIILAGLYGTGLTIVGLKFGFLIGLFSGLISIIPYAGFTLGFAGAIMMALAHYTGMGTIFGIMTVFIIVQTLEGLIITPKLVGDKVGLSSFATMLALIIGGNLLGLFGMLLAIPLAAILKCVIAELKTEFQQSQLYREGS